MNRPLASKKTLADISRVIKAKPNSLALIGERGAGKRFISEYLAVNIFESDKTLELNPNFHTLDAYESGIEEVREFQKKLTLRVPGDGDIKRIAVIEHFDFFGHQAQNAFLKTLEEPPIDTMLILTMDNPKDVLSTILSRVQILNIPALTNKTINEYFAKREPKDLSKYISLSGGSAGLLFSLISGDESHEMLQAISKCKDIIAQPKFKRISSIESITKDKSMSVNVFLDALIRVLFALERQAVNSENRSTIDVANSRLSATLQASDDIKNGLNQKLALTRLFLSF